MIPVYTFHSPVVSKLARLITLFAIFLGVFGPVLAGENAVSWVVLVIILLGIPHGASDYLVFRLFVKSDQPQSVKWTFYGYYLAAIIGYGLLWYFYAQWAFVLFVLVSVYHFGQSHWHALAFSNRWQARLVYLLWGGFVLGFPILIHHEEAATIVTEITGKAYVLDDGIRRVLIGLSFFGNVVVLSHLNERSILSDEAFAGELVNLCLLAALFSFTPLLVGFSIYFVVWHSLAATLDQIGIFRQLYKGTYNSQMYLRQIVPMSLLAIAGLVVLGYYQYQWAAQPLGWGTLFLFISIITTPHAILIDRLYERALVIRNGTSEEKQ